MNEFAFGLDPVDFRHQDEHSCFRFVSHFIVINESGESKSYFVSWSHALTFRRFLALFNVRFIETSEQIKCKLIRFNLDRFYSQLKTDFPNEIGSTFDTVKWSDIDDSGIIHFRKFKNKL